MDDLINPERMDAVEMEEIETALLEAEAAEDGAETEDAGLAQAPQPEPEELRAATVLAEIQPVPRGEGEPSYAAMEGVDRRDIQELLADSVGRYVICEFLLGSHQIIRREGVLIRVGCSFFVLYEEQSATQMVCNLYTAKFITVLPPGQRPQEQPRQPQSRASGLYPPVHGHRPPCR